MLKNRKPINNQWVLNLIYGIVASIITIVVIYKSLNP